MYRQNFQILIPNPLLNQLCVCVKLFFQVVLALLSGFYVYFLIHTKANGTYFQSLYLVDGNTRFLDILLWGICIFLQQNKLVQQNIWRLHSKMKHFPNITQVHTQFTDHFIEYFFFDTIECQNATRR